MPKRSNDFQKLVFLLKKQLGENATVTESKLLKDLFGEGEREVDVCVETLVASDPVMVCIECIDHNRPASVKWVEEMHGKHAHLPTNALILVSRRGFCKKAVALARLYNIQLLRFDEITENDIDRVFGNLDSLWIKVFTLSPNRVVVRVASTGELSAEDVTALPDDSIHAPDGAVISTMRALVENQLHVKQVVEELAKRGDTSHKSFVVGWRYPMQPAPLHLQMLNPHTLRQIESIEVHGGCEFEISKFPLRHGLLGNVRVSWGKGGFTGKHAFLVASKDQAGMQRIAIEVEGVKDRYRSNNRVK